MRHFYFRLILGIVFICCMIYSFVTMNVSFALLYIFLGGVLLYSAYSIWKKEKRSLEVSGMSSATFLSLNKLSVWYTADHPVLSDFSLDLGTNEVVGLIGLNGAGKTTFIKTVAGLLSEYRLDSAAWNGQTFSFRDKAFKRSDTLFLRKIGLFSISHSGNIWRMWPRLMAYRCRMCPGW